MGAAPPPRRPAAPGWLRAGPLRLPGALLTPAAPRRLEPLAPTVANRARLDARARWVAPVVRTLLLPMVRLEVVGAEAFPRTGPCLVLANHVSQLDPVLVSLAAGRPIQWMASESLLDADLVGRLAVPWGIVPKKKFTTDARAVRELLRWVRVDAAAGLFPEGQRTWDGRPLPLLPGIERLVRALPGPVVTARILNADHQWPRWAAVPRSARVRVELDPPRRFTSADEPEAVRAALEAALRVDPEASPRWPARGVRLASGVTNLLFACPSCFAVDALREDGDHLRCGRCGAGWVLDGALRLHPARGGAPEPLRAASDRLRAHFAAAGMRDPARADGLVLESEPVRLLDRTGDEPVVVAEGPMRLHPDALTVGDAFRLPWREVASVSAEQRRRLWIRTSDRLFEPTLDRQSTAAWEWFGEHWRRAAAPSE